MNEAINSLTSEMVRSCHVMSSFYMKKWRTNDEEEAVVRALTAQQAPSSIVRGAGRTTAQVSTTTTSRMARMSEIGNASNATRATSANFTRTVVRVQQENSDNNGPGGGHKEEEEKK